MNEAVAAAQTDGNALSRSLRPRHVAMITIGGIIGAGLFVGSSVAITAAGPAIVITYALTGSLVLLIMRMLGEMAVDMPQVRSFTEFTRAALGNWAGFSVGWLYWYFWVVVIPVEAIAGAGIIEHWLPLPRWEVGLALMALMTWVNLMSRSEEHTSELQSQSNLVCRLLLEKKIQLECFICIFVWYVT